MSSDFKITMASDRENNSLSNQDIEEDAQRESGTIEVEHYDVAIVYAGNNKETALDIMYEMSEIVLKNGDKPKVCLYSDPKCAASEVAAGEEITKICTLIFVLVTRDLHEDTVAQLIKDEAIGNTRLANSCHPDLKYSVRPLYIEKNRDYKAPCGLSTIRSVDWYEKDSRFFKRNINMLFENHMQYRKKRERAMYRQNSERTRCNTSQCNINHLEPEQLPLPPTSSMDENKNLNYMVSEISAQYTPSMSQSEVPENPNTSQSNTVTMPKEDPDEIRNFEVMSQTSRFVLATIQSEDSGRGSILPQAGSSYPGSVPVSESCGQTGDDERQTNKGSQSLSTIPQSSSSHGSGSFESRSHGFDATISNSRTSGDSSGIMTETNPQNKTNASEEASTNTSSDPSNLSQTSEEETDGSLLIQSDLTQTDVVEDVSMTSRKYTETQDLQSTEDSSLVARCPSANNGNDIISSQTSHELLNVVQSVSSRDENVTVGSFGEHDTDHKDTDDLQEINSGQDSSRELIQKHYGSAHIPVTRCAAPNDEFINDGKAAPAAVSPQPMVVHYHNHYHGDARGPDGFPPPPGAPPPNMAFAGMAGPTFEQPAERAQQITSGNQGNLRLRTEAPINIVNCATVQVGMNQMEVRGALREVSFNTTTDNDEQPMGIRTVPSDPPPAYTVEDPSDTGTVSSWLDSNQQHEPPSYTLLKEREQSMFKSPPQTDFDEMSVGCLEEDKTRDKEGGGQGTLKTGASAHPEVQSDSSSLQSVVTRDGTHSPQDSLSARNEEAELCSLPVPELGSPDDMKKFFQSLSEGREDQYASKDKSVSVSSDLKLQPCRLFCKHSRRQDMFVDMGRRMVAAGGPCVGPGGHDADID